LIAHRHKRHATNAACGSCFNLNTVCCDKRSARRWPIGSAGCSTVHCWCVSWRCQSGPSARTLHPAHPLPRIRLVHFVEHPLHGPIGFALCHSQPRPVLPAFDIRRRSRFQPSAAAGRVVIGCNLFGGDEAGTEWKRGRYNQQKPAKVHSHCSLRCRLAHFFGLALPSREQAASLVY
jgi:hypothetical protein